MIMSRLRPATTPSRWPSSSTYSSSSRPRSPALTSPHLTSPPLPTNPSLIL